MNGLVRTFHPVDHALDRAFSEVWPAFFSSGPSAAPALTIPLDVNETAEAYLVKAELPGVSREQISVNVEDRDLTIGVEVREEVDTNGKSLWKERRFGKASRAIRLPQPVDAAGAGAKYVDGVLTLTLPKQTKASQRQLVIQ